jgi:ATP-dependent exoDNAse (exonuclease V) alpha subunit
MKYKIKQYDTFTLGKDVNHLIVKGMAGVVLEIWSDDSYEVEFVKPDGTNYELNGQFIFTIDRSYIGEITWTQPD